MKIQHVSSSNNQSKRVFPCPYCKGAGGETEVVIEETGQGPYYECGWCEGEGMVELYGELHSKRKMENIGLDLLTVLSRSGDFEIGWDELNKMGEELKKVAKKYLRKASL